MVSHALRGAALTFRGDPFLVGSEAAMHYESDALVVLEDGRIKAFDPWRKFGRRRRFMWRKLAFERG